jgi:hypothetical protein
MVNLVERPNLFPGVTPLFRETAGPVAFLGELVDGVHVFVSRREFRELARAFNGLTEEDAAALRAENTKLEQQIAELEEELGPLRDLAAAIDPVFRAQRSKIRLPA